MKDIFAIVRILIFCSLTLVSSIDQAQVPTLKWTFHFNAPAFGQAVSDDLGNDGWRDIVFSTYMNDGKCYALRGHDGFKLWEFSTGDCNDAGPVVWDVDLDNQPEVVLASSCVTKMYCLNGADGAQEWEANTAGTDSPPAICDIDHDGRAEILDGQFDGSVISVNGEDGSIGWNIPVESNGTIQTSPTLLKLPYPGSPDYCFVVGTWSFGNNHKISAYNGATQALLWESNEPNDWIYHGGAYANLDLDMAPEIAFGCYDNHVYVLNADSGNLKWSFDFGANCYVGGPVSIGDLDGDLDYELVAAGWYKMKALTHDGQELWNYNIPGYASCFRGAALSDVSGEGINDVIFGTSDGKLIALNGPDGSHLWTIDLAALYGDTLDVDHQPIVDDLDGDLLPEIFIAAGFTDYPNIAGDYGVAYSFDVPQGYGRWPMFEHDIYRSSHVETGGIVYGVEDNSLDLLKTHISPNPFTGECRIRTTVSVTTDFRLRLLDINGKELIQPISEFRKPGDKVYVIDGKDLAEGVIIAEIDVGGVIHREKLVHLH